MIKFIVNTTTGEYIDCFIGVRELKENETLIEFAWPEGLYTPKFDFTTNTWIEGKPKSEIDAELACAEAHSELANIELWFKTYDHYPHKIITEEWLPTDERWLWYKAERKVKRARQDELNVILGGTKS